MENYQTNSNRSKRDEPRREPESKNIEKVVIGEVQRRKKPLGKQFKEYFIGNDARSVFASILLDVLIPSAKDTMADAVSQGVELMLFGSARSTSRRTGRLPFSHSSQKTYTNYSTGSSFRRDEGPSLSRRARATHNFDEIILATRPEAEEVIDRLFDLIGKYGNATVADLYDLIGVTGSFTDDKWGWTDLRGAGVERIRNGYVLNLPPTEPLA